MVTIGESISRVRMIIKATKEDAFITDRNIYSLISKYAKALIRRQDNERKLMNYDSLFEPLPFVELISVSKIEAECVNVKSNCTIQRTKLKLPKVFDGSKGPLFRNVFSIDGSFALTQTTSLGYISIKNSKTFKYNTAQYYWYQNGYLFFPDSQLEGVIVEAMWEDLLDGFCNPNNKSCMKMQEKRLSVPDYLFAEIEQMVEQEFMNTARLPIDTADDSQNILR